MDDLEVGTPLKQQSELVSEGGGDYSRDNSDDENDEKMKRGIFQKKKNRETFKPYNVFGKSGVDREPFDKRCPTMQSHCDNQLLQAYRYNGNGSSYLVNYSNNVANMKEKPYEVFPPLGRNVSFVAYVNSIKAFAGELLPFPEEEENEDDKVKTPTQKTRKNGFIAKWVKERTEGCDAWRDLMYIPEPPRVQVMQKVTQGTSRQFLQRQTLLVVAVRQNSPRLLPLPPPLSSRTRVHSPLLNLNSAFSPHRRHLRHAGGDAQKSDWITAKTATCPLKKPLVDRKAHPDTSFSANLSGW